MAAPLNNAAKSERWHVHDDRYHYHYGAFAVEDIAASEILMDHVVAKGHRLFDDFAGAIASVGTNPAADWTADIQVNGVSIGSLEIDTAGVATFTTTGSFTDVEIGDVVTVIAPAVADASIERLRFTLQGRIRT